jgi:photosystem II stability/assembly factor-like uncharacterized protein
MASFGLLAMALRTQEKEEPDLQRQRQEWFYRQRAYPHTYVPAGAHQHALKQLEQKLAAEKSTRGLSQLSTPASNPSWTFIGPQPINTPYTDPVVSGRVTALVIDPGDVNTVYLGGAQGGVWKTTNGGTTWTALTDTQASTAIGSIALDPSNSSTIYVGTGEENFSGDSYYGAGILKSIDGGTTWTQFCGPFCGPVGQDGHYGGGARIGGLAVHPTNSQILLAAVGLLFKDGVYRSADGGNSWTSVLSGNPANSVLFDPTNGNVAYASLGSDFSGSTEGVFKSTDGGQTWTAANGTGVNVLNLTNAGRIVLAMAPSSSTTLYAGIANIVTGDLLGLFKTTDGGANWTQLTSTPNYCGPLCSYANVIAVQPTNPNVVFAGGGYTTTLVRSLDGGTTWATLQSAQNFGFLHADMHALAFFPDGNTLYLGNDGGAYVTTQIIASNPSFTALNSTLGLTQFYPGLSVDPTNAAIALGGTQDNGTVIYSGALTWNDVACGDGGYTAIDFITPATMYTTCQKFNIFKSTSNGAFGSWNAALNGINTGDRVDFIPPLVMDPSNSQTLYFGTDRVYQTTNGASSWTAISPDLTGGDSFFGVLSTIAVAPTNSNTVYVGTLDNRVQVTTNADSGAAATWTNISAGLPPRVVTHVAVDPTTSTIAYATFSGFTGFGDNLGHVFKTTNGGSAWADISGDLPNTPVNFIVIDPDAPSTLFAATDVGVFYSTTGGTSWTSLVTGLPRVAVLGLTLHNASRTLRASTHGRGAWDLQLPTPSHLANISTRGLVQTGSNVMIGGFVISGTQPKKVIIHAGGPSLAQFGLAALSDPNLQLYDSSGAVIAKNDNWQTTEIFGIITSDQVSDIQNSGHAPSEAADSAIIVTLDPGAYTAIVSGVNGATGIGIVEVYDLDTGSRLVNISTRGLVQTGANVLIGGFVISGTQPEKVIIHAGGPSLAQFGLAALSDPNLQLYDSSGAVIAKNDNWQTTEIFGIITSDQVSDIQNSGHAPSEAADSAIIVTLDPGAYTAIVSGVNGATGIGIVEVFDLQ